MCKCYRLESREKLHAPRLNEISRILRINRTFLAFYGKNEILQGINFVTVAVRN